MLEDHPLANFLLADEARPDLAQELQLFGQFEGAWDLDVTWYQADGTTRSARGEWHFGWILGGRAIQDVWIVPSSNDDKAQGEIYEHGTSVRFYDARIAAWRSTWMGPVQGSVRTFLAQRRGEEIVLEGQQLAGRDIQWVFSDIAQDSFAWRFERRAGDGQDWELVQTFQCWRRR